MEATIEQAVNPELNQWIVEQATAGYTADQLLASMLSTGWSQDVATRALEEHLPATITGSILSAQKVRPQIKPHMPDVNLSGSPYRIDAGDRWVDVIFSMSEPRLVVLGNVLSDYECDAIIEAARPSMSRSFTIQPDSGGEEENPVRTSFGMFFQRGQNDLIARVEARIARLVGWPQENGEGMQVLHYAPGAKYEPHNDYFDPAALGAPVLLKRGGQRLATFLMYLHSPEQGGGTVFPDVNVEVAPQRGNAVFFSYERPEASSKTLHGGAPVIKGEKWVATKWLRRNEFS
jgi:prolyl 4-hydroxylase